ncbi:unnamed protein product, partial [Allacma fusca]
REIQRRLAASTMDQERLGKILKSAKHCVSATIGFTLLQAYCWAIQCTISPFFVTVMLWHAKVMQKYLCIIYVIVKFQV